MPYAIENITPVLTEYLFPTVMMWNRVEGRPRATKNFDRALKAEVRDALWMLTKQWQMGEFEGDDAGSPVLAKLRMDTTQLLKYKANQQPAQPFPENIPLEAQVEQKILPMNVFGQKVSLDLRLMAGHRWKKILNKAGLIGQVWNLSLENFPIHLPDPSTKTDASICAHPDAWQQFTAVAGRAVDGFDLYFYLKKGLKLQDLPSGGLLADEPQDAIDEFTGWIDQLFLQPNDPVNNAWIPSHLENEIISKLEHFMLELGKGFLFEGRQKRFTFDGDSFFVDLVLYNRLLKCYVLVDLKIGKLTHQDIGQMQMYVNYYDRKIKVLEENSTIGIILCKEDNKTVVEFTVPKDNKTIFAKEYKLYLPSKEQLRKQLE